MLKIYYKRKINEKRIIIWDSNYFNLYSKDEEQECQIFSLFSQKMLK